MVGFVFDVDNGDFCVRGSDIFRLSAFVEFELVVEGRRDVICVDILGRGKPTKEKVNVLVVNGILNLIKNQKKSNTVESTPRDLISYLEILNCKKYSK